MIPHPHAHSRKLLLPTKPSLFRNCSSVTDLVFLYFAVELLLSPRWYLTGRAQRFPSSSANLQERWNGEGRAKPVLLPKLNQASLWHLICKINPQPFCSAFKPALKRLCFFIPQTRHAITKQRKATPKKIMSQSPIYSQTPHKTSDFSCLYCHDYLEIAPEKRTFPSHSLK